MVYYNNDYEDFIYDDDNYVNVWVDGSCLGNGKPWARAGYGVFFNWEHELNASEPVDGRATNNVGEIQAAIHAIWTCSNEGVRRLRINTDSKFLCNAVWYWMERWEENDFCKTNGDPLANQDDFMELSHALNENDHMDIDFVHVHAHSGNKYNNAADRLARDGAHQYEYEY